MCAGVWSESTLYYSRPSANRRVVELSSDQTLRIDNFLQSKGFSSPSAAPYPLNTLGLPEDLLPSCDAILEATDELHILMLGLWQFVTSITARILAHWLLLVN